MPCNADHMEANSREVKYSKLLCLLGELEGKKWETREWAGYHPKAYCKNLTTAQVNEAAQKLCAALTEAGDVTQYSLEMQIWWRDHQAADTKRRSTDPS